MTLSQKRKILTYGLLYSSFLALVSFLFIITEGYFAHLFLHTIPDALSYKIPYYIGLYLISSLLLYLIKKYWGNVPQISHQVISELKEHKTVEYRHAHRNLIAALLILSVGAGVGPEGPLLATIISYSIWQADKIRYFVFTKRAGPSSITEFFHPTKYITKYNPENANKYKKERKRWTGFFILNGIVVFMLLMAYTNQPSFITKLGTPHLHGHHLLYIPILIALSVISAKVINLFRRLLGQGLNSLSKKRCLSIFVGGTTICIFAIFLPGLLGSGQHSMPMVVDMALTLPWYTLLGLSYLKLIFLDVSFGTGWKGGDIFPLLISCVLQGFAFASSFPFLDPFLVVCIVSICFAIGLSPSHSSVNCIFITLFFPWTLWPVSIGILVVYNVLEKLYLKHKGGAYEAH